MNLYSFRLELTSSAKRVMPAFSFKTSFGYLVFSILLTAVGCGGDDVSRFDDDDIPSPVGQTITDGQVTPSDPGAAPATEGELAILPTVAVGARQFSDPNVLITLNANAEAAGNATITTTLWTQIDGPAVEIPNPDQRQSIILVPDLLEETQLLFRFVAQDSEGRLNSATTSVVVRPTPAFTRVVGSVTNEVQDAATFTIRLSSPQPSDVSVTYATQDGTAQAGTDYLAMEGTLVFAAGETENMVTIPILNNDPEEENEFFSLAINTFASDTVTFNTGIALIQNNPELTPDIQNIAFSNPGPIALNVGDRLQNIIAASSAPGSGELTYESSDPQIASVDTEGNVTAVAAGSVAIMATKAADPIYPLSAASYQLNVSDTTEPALAGLGNQTFIIGEPISPLRFFNEGGGRLSSCQQTDLPQGLVVSLADNNNTCEISGTPAVLQVAIVHTISATNSAGSSSANVTITVVNPDAPMLDGSGPQTYSVGSTIPTFVFSNSGGGSLIKTW